MEFAARYAVHRIHVFPDGGSQFTSYLASADDWVVTKETNAKMQKDSADHRRACNFGN